MVRATVPQRAAPNRIGQRPRRPSRTQPSSPPAYTPACRGQDVDLFDGDGELALFAMALCRQCRFQAACLDYALGWDVQGVWGGTTGGERVELRRQRGLPSPRALSWDDAEPLTSVFVAAS
ncbi:MAG: hypothetical protein GEU88_21150 [Solirubrobacterales bacterium]|nr:hypothetical protein [Solirubrobacterales bacterium]